jgi:hypothetical protein
LSKDTYRLPFKIGLTASEQMLLYNILRNNSCF